MVLSPYTRLIRLHQPAGIWLLFWPCSWAVLYAAPFSQKTFIWLLLFAGGAFCLRSAGCVINDIIDRKIDSKVARTKNRPLASGELSVKQALFVLSLLLLVGLCVVIWLPVEAIIAAFLFFIPVIIYPFMKRVLAWPQLFLAVTFNAGAVVGWITANDGVINQPLLPMMLLYLGCACWTIGYDTIYAHQDKKDDQKAGVKSTALSMNSKSPMYVALFYGLCLAALVALAFLKFEKLPYFLFLALFIGGLQLAWQVKTVDWDNPADCAQKFRSNQWFGAIIFLGLMLERTI